jgi:hypothetical protein
LIRAGLGEEDSVVDGVLAQYVWKGSIPGLNELRKPNMALMANLE